MKATQLANKVKPVVRVGVGVKARTVVISDKPLRPTGNDKEIPTATVKELELLQGKYPMYITKK